MRKLFILLIYCLLLTNYSLSQNSKSLYTVNSDKSEDLIVRSYGISKSVASSFAAHRGFTLFYLQVNDIISKERAIFDIHVRDFIIHHDTVFFCGESIEGNGVVGFFDIYDFFNNYGDYYIQDFFYVDEEYYVSDLYKLVIYYDRFEAEHIFALGYLDIFDISNHYFGCFVDLLNTGSGFTQYTIGYVNKSDYKTFLDVALVGDYIVTVGYEYEPSLGIRIFKKDDLFSPYGPQNRTLCLYLHSSGGIFKWDAENAAITSVMDNSFATAAIDKRIEGLSESDKRVHFLTFDIDSVLNLSFNTIHASRRLTAIGYYPYKINEFRYNESQECYSILFQSKDIQSSNEMSAFVELSANYNNIVMNLRDYCEDCYWDSLRFESFDIIRGLNQYLLLGDCRYDSFLKIFLTENSSLQSTCYPYQECSLLDYYKYFQSYIESTVIPVRRNTELRRGNDGTILPHPMIIDCQ